MSPTSTPPRRASRARPSSLASSSSPGRKAPEAEADVKNAGAHAGSFLRRAIGFLAIGLALAAPLAACIGDDPTLGMLRAEGNPAAEDAGGSANDSPASPSDDGDDNADPDASALDGDMVDERDASLAKDSSVVDGSSRVDAEAGVSPVACVQEPLAMGAFHTRCTASASTITPGGTIAVGTYLLSRAWDAGGCMGGVYVIGSATVFQQDGKTYMRYVRIRKATTTDPGTTTTGALELDPGASGTITQTERCDPRTKGATKTGRYQVLTTGADISLTLDFADQQTAWKKQ